MKKFIAYYRVSTSKQGRSGLGLEAQKKTVADFIKGDKTTHLIAEYKDVESGKNDNRPHLVEAIDHAKKSQATLLIAKLDRLSRNVSFIFMLKDSKVDFVACDIPDANTLTIGIFAVVAQHEREIISKRIKEALAAKKARGFKLGMPENLQPKDRLKGLQTRIVNARANKNNLQASETIKHLRKCGHSFMAIASRLNELEYTTRRGKSFYPITVQRLYERSR